MEELYVRYFHFLSIIVLASALVGEHLLLSKKMPVNVFKKVIVLDAIYCVSAVTTLVSGLLLWLSFGKPAEFYSSNYIFHIKLTLYVAIALLSIFPTVYFLRNLKTKEHDIILPQYLISIIRLELLLFLPLPLLGVLIAKGIGL